MSMHMVPTCQNYDNILAYNNVKGKAAVLYNWRELWNEKAGAGMGAKDHLNLIQNDLGLQGLMTGREAPKMV